MPIDERIKSEESWYYTLIQSNKVNQLLFKVQNLMYDDQYLSFDRVN
jgi:hypothetical protein